MGVASQPAAPAAAPAQAYQPQYTPQPAYSAPPPAGYGAPYAAAPQWVSAPATAYAGFWRRFFAYLIDGLILGIGFVAVVIALGTLGMTAGMGGGNEAVMAAAFTLLPIMILFTLVGGWLYFAYMESSEKQGTLGKLAIGIKVTDLAGNRISFGHATGRYFAKIITGLIPFGIGYMLAGFTQRKQALHDMIASTLVLCR